MIFYERLIKQIHLPDDELRKCAKKFGFPSCQAYIDNLHEDLEDFRPKKSLARAQASLDAARKKPQFAFEYYQRVCPGCCKSVDDMLKMLEDDVETAKKYSAYTPEEISRHERHGLRVSG